MSKNICLIGSARHGKDTVAEILQDLFWYRFESSSVAAARLFLYDILKEKYGYKNFLECFDDRVNRRKEWYELIREYNKDDKARLAKEVLTTSHVYVGMRDHEELDECIRQGIFDLIIGVYDPRKPLEPSSSFTIDFWGKSDIVISNAGTINDLKNKIAKLGYLFNKKEKVLMTI